MAIALLSGTAGFVVGKDAGPAPPPTPVFDDDVFLNLMKKHLATPQPGDARGFFAEGTGDVEASGPPLEDADVQVIVPGGAAPGDGESYPRKLLDWLI